MKSEPFIAVGFICLWDMYVLALLSALLDFLSCLTAYRRIADSITVWMMVSFLLAALVFFSIGLLLRHRTRA